jgi:hypothetical protein
MSKIAFCVGVASMLVGQAAWAQDSVQETPDLTFYQLQSQVVFQGPTLVVLVPSPQTMSPLDPSAEMAEWRASVTQLIEAARAVAGPLGFQVVARDPLYARLSARDGGAVYAAPRDAATGYIIVAPLRRPRLQAGYLSAEALLALLQDYQTPARPLAL